MFMFDWFVLLDDEVFILIFVFDVDDGGDDIFSCFFWVYWVIFVFFIFFIIFVWCVWWVF